MKTSQAYHVHILGIGGVSMSALAKHYLHEGYFVSGEDRVENEYTEQLKQLGVVFGPCETADKIVASSAIETVPQTDIPVLSRAEAWNEIMSEYKTTIGVAGSHGKTTATAMLAHIFLASGKKFTSHIGGNDRTLGNYANFGKDYLILESCEYKKNFLSMIPDVALLLNVDSDHMECYRDEAELVGCFFSFCKRAKTCVVPFGMPIDGVTYGYKTGDYRATHVVGKRGKYAFTLWRGENKLARIKLNAVGRHNVWNALAVSAVACECGISPEQIKKGLEGFLPVHRRFEKLGTYRGAEVIADYAHHPCEIATTISSAKQRARGKVIVVFQPHTYSRTKYFMQEFAEVLQGAILYKTFPAREPFDEDGTAKRLADQTKNSRYADSERELISLLKARVRRRDCILFLGAGDVYEIAKRIIT